MEKNNTNSIILHKEGIFWSDYEKSAYLFIIHIKEFKTTKKRFNNINSDVVYLGFPANSLDNLLQIDENYEIIKN